MTAAAMFLVFSFLLMAYLCRHDIADVCKQITADDFSWNLPVLEQLGWVLAKIFLVSLGILAINVPLYYVVYVALAAFLVYRYIKKMPKRNKTRDDVPDNKHDNPTEVPDKPDNA